MATLIAQQADQLHRLSVATDSCRSRRSALSHSAFTHTRFLYESGISRGICAPPSTASVAYYPEVLLFAKGVLCVPFRI
jgi:hypothetical protein